MSYSRYNPTSLLRPLWWIRKEPCTDVRMFGNIYSNSIPPIVFRKCIVIHQGKST